MSYSGPYPQYPGGPDPDYGRSRGPRAGFWIRFLAWLIDTVLLGVINALIRAALGNAAEIPVVVIGVAYIIGFLGSPRGQTPGFMAVGIRAVSLDTGGPIGYGRAAVRYLASIVSALVFLLGYFWMLWDPEKQTWHDKAASSVVVPVAAYPLR